MSAEDDLYGDLDDALPRLASTTGLAAELSTVRTQREALERQLQELRARGTGSREAIQDLTRRACVLLATARRELQRKDEQLEACSTQISNERKKRERHKRQAEQRNLPQSAAAPVKTAPLQEVSDEEEDDAVDRDPKRRR